MAKGGIDKEALKKHQFWIVLGAFGVLWIVAFITVKVAASDAKKKAYDEAKKAIDGAWTQGPKTEAYQVPWRQHGTLFRNHKDVIWGQAWQRQEPMYTWPESMPPAVRPKYIEDHFGPPGDTATDLKNRAEFRTVWYNELFEGLENYVSPAEFIGGRLENVMPPQQWDPAQPPTREEIWLAMEDYWVRREMLVMIHEAMAAVAHFHEVAPPKGKEKDKEKLPEGVVGKRVFRNANWELTLLLEPREKGGKVLVISDKSTIKNINAAERTLMLAHPKTNKGLPFRVEQGRAGTEFYISGEPLAYGAVVEVKQKFNVLPVDLSKPFELHQVLAWELSPVRRVDALQLAYHSHRTVTAGLKINEELKKLDPEPEGTAGGTGEGAAGGSPAPGAPTGMMKGGMMGGGEGGGPGGPGGAGGSGDATRINGIPRERYMYITPQCRHLPIALKLLIDQAHIHDVLAAIANSRLRIQVTQVTVNHDPAAGGQQAGSGGFGGPPPGTGGGPSAGSGGPSAGSGGRVGPPPGVSASRPGGGMYGGTGGSPRPGGGMGGLAGLPGRFFPGMGGRGRGGMGTGEGEGTIGMGPGMPGGLGGATETGVSTFQDTAQLIELSVYGIASLYERFPPRPKTGEAPTTGGTAAPPAAITPK
jgi:hypothetical protein